MFDQHRPEDDFWDTVLHIALVGKLDRIDEAKLIIGELEKVNPDFASRARELMLRSFRVDSLIEDMIDGQRRAGLAVDEVAG